MFLQRFVRAGLALLAAGVSPGLPHAAEILAGPYAAEVETVVDGDTIAVRVPIWIGQEIRVLVRIRGVDAPEKRARCEGERRLSDRATAALAGLVAGGRVTLRDIAGDKYWGRVVADVSAPDGTDLGRALLARALVRAYDGGARGGWC
ncbi:thermonuclease family protein [Propylenella binzhouense]|uniref:Thermonuclease family protein n=1 Tax=Propylenella binzhouense TaxID=2555902 RepID=A0A964T7U9_9HYPH|nr:thermonuclease family protein [Propylenella binzhouense]MYZ50049.1 thermonuclease family protein [Propylenella binzhouense]